MPSHDESAAAQTPFNLRQQFLATLSSRASLALGVVNAALFTGTAAAQTPAPKRPAPAPSTGTATLPEIVVQADRNAYNPEQLYSPKYTEPLLNVPQSISIIPKAVMREQNATNLRDVLRNVSGITIQAGEGGATPGDNFVIRGFSARTDMYIDGVRDVGGFYRDPFNIEQVEVTKGPASTYAGRGSTGGSINIVTKVPTSERFYLIDLSAGTSDFYRGTIDFNQPFHFGPRSPIDPKNPVEELPNAAVRVNAMWQESDVAGRDETHYQRWGVAPSIAFGLNTPTQLTLSYVHLDQNNVPDFGVPWVPVTNNALASLRDQPAPVSYENHYGIYARDFERLRTDEGSLIVNHEFSDNLSARYIFHYGRNIRDSIISAPRFISPDSPDINREFQSRDQEDTIVTNGVDFTIKGDTFGTQHTLVAGIEYTREKSTNYLRGGPAAPLADLYDPDVMDHFAGPITRTGAVNEAETETVALYLFDTIKFGEKWMFTGGLRYDYFDVDYDSRDAAGVVTPFDHLDKEFSWRAALSYKPTANGAIYFGYGTSFNPSAEGLTLTPATAELDPEKSRSFELGAKWDFLDHKLSVNGAVFHTFKENARTPGAAPGDPPTVLQGEQEVTGFEVGVTGNLTANWKIIAGYTYLDTEITKSNTPAEVGKRLPGVPENSASLWTTYAITPKFDVGVGAQFVDTRFANPINTREADSYVTFDAMAAYRVNDHLTIRANVYNFTDEEYISGLHIQGSFGHFIPGVGRTATITASLAF